MEIIKKNWMYDINIIIVVLIASVLGLGAGFLIFSGSSVEVKEVLYAIFEQLYIMVTGALCMYPMFAFKGICPQLGSDKIYLSTVNLPFSKKQLFFKALKPWLIIFPLNCLAGAFVVAVLSKQTESFGLLYLFALLKPTVLIILAGTFQLQVISAVIFSLVKGIKWYKILGAVVVSNGVLGSLCALVIWLLNIDMNTNFYWIIGIVLTFVIASLLVFLVAWRKVEEIHR